MNEDQITKAHGFTWLPSDRLVDIPQYRKILMDMLTTDTTPYQILLPVNKQSSNKVPFVVYEADKIGENFAIWEYSGGNPLGWMGIDFPPSITAGVITLFDPRIWYNVSDDKNRDLSRDKIDDNLAILIDSQKRHLQKCKYLIIDHNLLIIFIYIRDKHGLEPLPVAKLIEEDLLPLVHVLSYHIDALDNLANDLRAILSAI